MKNNVSGSIGGIINGYRNRYKPGFRLEVALRIEAACATMELVADRLYRLHHQFDNLSRWFHHLAVRIAGKPQGILITHITPLWWSIDSEPIQPNQAIRWVNEKMESNS